MGLPKFITAAEKLKNAQAQREKDRADAERVAREHAIRYSLPTLIGNWSENKHLLDYQIEEYNRKRERCQTFLQKQSYVGFHLFEEMDIAKFNKTLCYGAPIKINSELSPLLADEDPDFRLCLACIITEKQIDQDNTTSLNDKSVVTAAPSNDLKRIRRQIFCIESAKLDKTGDPVLYGDEIFIRVFNSGGEKLYLQCQVPHTDNFGEIRDIFLVGLASVPDRYCKFRIVDSDPNKNLLLIGEVVPTFSRIAFNNILTNRLLAIEIVHPVITMLGTDYQVSCFTYKNLYKQVTDQNVWHCITQTVGEVDAPVNKH